MIVNSISPVLLKQADIQPIYKRHSNNYKRNYKPVSILHNLSKIYERCLYTVCKVLDSFFNPILSKYQFGFKKGYNEQQFLLTMTEKWRAFFQQDELKPMLRIKQFYKQLKFPFKISLLNVTRPSVIRR